MGHYEERLDKDLSRIRKQVRIVGELVENALANAARAVLTVDSELASETILGDLHINRETRELDRLVHGFVARHLPSAGHLRYVSSVLRLNIGLERIGDYAETISRTAVQLSQEPPESVSVDIRMMADQARRLYHRSMKAFHAADPSHARDTIAAARQLMPSFDKVYLDLVSEGEKGSRPVRDLFGFLATCNRLERVIHQAKNICEETLFAATGETKPQKVFDVLFLDERNDGASHMAEHFARKAFNQIGVFQSAGWEPAAQMNPRFVAFAEQHGLDLSEAWPRALSSIPEDLSEFEIIVALDKDVRSHLERVPFHTVLLVWGLEEAGDPERAYKELSPRIGDLMEKLRGEER